MPSARAQEIAAALLQDPAQLKARILAEKARRSGSRSFAAFVQQAWPYVPSCDPLVWGWHMGALCEHSEEVAYGRIQKLAINIGPGHAKSVIESVLFPAWIWTWWPKCQFIGASYAEALAIRDSVRCRAVIESDWYVSTFMVPGGWRLRDDQNAKGYFMNTAGGERFSVGIGGSGRRGHVFVVDDPIDQVKVHSATVREATEEWLNLTVSQRFVDPKQPRFLMIGQRLHAEDTFANIGSDWERLVLPTEFDPDNRARTYHLVTKANDNGVAVREREVFWEDPRIKPGDLLFPERFSRDVVERFKQPGVGNLGPDGFACQHNQKPRAFEGGMFRRVDWRFYRPEPELAKHWTAPRPRGCTTEPAIPLPPMFEDELLSMDAAFKASPAGSRVAIHCWARRGADRFLRYRHTDLLDFGASKAALRTAAQHNPRATRKLVEDAANGPAIINELRHEVPGIIAVSPSKYGSKTARAAAAQPYQRAGNCYLPEGAPWLEDFISLFAAFPSDQADDVDAFSQAMRGLEEQPVAETGRVNWGRR